MNKLLSASRLIELYTDNADGYQSTTHKLLSNLFDGFIFFVKENGLYYIDDWYGLPAGGMDDTVWTVLPKEGIV